MYCTTFAFLPIGIGPGEMLVVGIIALLLFGKRLPEVARSLGKGMIEFKKGMQGIEDEVRSAGSTSYSAPSRPVPTDERKEVTAPKFEPPAFSPQEQEAKNDQVEAESSKQSD